MRLRKIATHEKVVNYFYLVFCQIQDKFPKLFTFPRILSYTQSLRKTTISEIIKNISHSEHTTRRVKMMKHSEIAFDVESTTLGCVQY